MRGRDYEEGDHESSREERHGRPRPGMEMWRHGGVGAIKRIVEASQVLDCVNCFARLGGKSHKSYQAN